MKASASGSFDLAADFPSMQDTKTKRSSPRLQNFCAGDGSVKGQLRGPSAGQRLPAAVSSSKRVAAADISSKTPSQPHGEGFEKVDSASKLQSCGSPAGNKPSVPSSSKHPSAVELPEEASSQVGREGNVGQLSLSKGCRDATMAAQAGKVAPLDPLGNSSGFPQPLQFAESAVVVQQTIPSAAASFVQKSSCSAGILAGNFESEDGMLMPSSRDTCSAGKSEQTSQQTFPSATGFPPQQTCFPSAAAATSVMSTYALNLVLSLRLLPWTNKVA